MCSRIPLHMDLQVQTDPARHSNYLLNTGYSHSHRITYLLLQMYLEYTKNTEFSTWLCILTKQNMRCEILGKNLFTPIFNCMTTVILNHTHQVNPVSLYLNSQCLESKFPGNRQCYYERIRLTHGTRNDVISCTRWAVVALWARVCAVTLCACIACWPIGIPATHTWKHLPMGQGMMSYPVPGWQ